MDTSEDIFLNVRSAVIVRTISMLNPPPLRKSTVIRFGGAVATRGCFVLEEGEDVDDIILWLAINYHKFSQTLSEDPG